MDNNNQKKEEDKRKGRRIFFTSFLTFMIIATLQSCQEARLREKAMTGEIIDSNIPRITYEDIMKPTETKEEKTSVDLLEERIRELTEEMDEEEEIVEEASFSK